MGPLVRLRVFPWERCHIPISSLVLSINVYKRLEGNSRFEELYQFIDKTFSLLKTIPRHLIPKYFIKTISLIKTSFENKIFNSENGLGVQFYVNNSFIIQNLTYFSIIRILFSLNHWSFHHFKWLPIFLHQILKDTHQTWQLDYHISVLDGQDVGDVILSFPLKVFILCLVNKLINF